MSLLSNLGRLKPILNVPKSFKNQVKCVSYHYPDWKPGPYPKTKEEREAAAKKYGMLPEEYEPYPDDGSGFGDYPMVPNIPDNEKDLNIPYMDQGIIVRNFNDPISPYYLSVTAEKKTKKLHFKGYEPHPVIGILGLFAAVGVWGVFVYVFFGDHTRYHTMAPKQYPYQGETHYKFEVVED